jgi:hypothetical protein
MPALLPGPLSTSYGTPLQPLPLCKLVLKLCQGEETIILLRLANKSLVGFLGWLSSPSSSPLNRDHSTFVT